MLKSLAEAKLVLRTENVHEVDAAFIINMFGKYAPNITFVVQKDFNESPIAYRSDEPTKQMLASMNVTFSGETSVLFGDFWKSQKGGACFRPKPASEARHVLIRCNWGGAFNRTRGIFDYTASAVRYYHRAASTGGGLGADYLVVPIGFDRSAADLSDFAERAKAIREAFGRHDREQAAREEAKATAKAKVEAESAAAKDGLRARLEAARARLIALDSYELIELQDTTFVFWTEFYYTEESVREVEQEIEELEEKKRRGEVVI